MITQRPCCIENGAVNFVRLVFASSEYGRGECVLGYAIVRSAAKLVRVGARGGRALVRCVSTE